MANNLDFHSSSTRGYSLSNTISDPAQYFAWYIKNLQRRLF